MLQLRVRVCAAAIPLLLLPLWCAGPAVVVVGATTLPGVVRSTSENLVLTPPITSGAVVMPRIRLEQADGVGESMDIYVDSAGHGHVGGVNVTALEEHLTGCSCACADGAGAQGTTASSSSSSASDRLLDVADSGDGFTNVAVRSNGLPVVVYTSNSGRSLMIALCTSKLCEGVVFRKTLRTTANAVDYATLSLDGHDRPFVTMHRTDSQDYVSLACHDPMCKTLTFTDTFPGTDTGYFVSHALWQPEGATEELPVIVQRKELGGGTGQLQLVACKTRDCQSKYDTINVDTTASAGYWATVTPLNASTVGVAYRRNDNLYYETCTLSLGGVNLVCSGSPVLVDGNGPRNSYAQSTLASDGTLVVAYRGYADPSNGTLWAAFCERGDCSTPTLVLLDGNAGVNAGGWIGLALDSQDRPSIVHWDSLSDDLLLVTCNDARCSSFEERTLISFGSVGKYASIAIRNDITFISLLDSSNSRILLLRCDTRSCNGVSA